MNFTQAVTVVLTKKYADFSGRASIAEFWWYALFVLIVQGIIWGIFTLMGGYEWLASIWEVTMAGGTVVPVASGGIKFLAGLSLLIGLAFLIPNLAVTTRRFHDRGMSGWWLVGLIIASFIPFLGMFAYLAILIICALSGNDGDNKYGAKPVV